MKKRSLIYIGIGLLASITFAFLMSLASVESRNISDISVIEINWDYSNLMNDRIIAVYFSDPPFFEDERIDAANHLEYLLDFFGKNHELLRDTRLPNDMDVIFKFENVEKENYFLLNDEVFGDFTLHFYFDRTLADEFFAFINEAIRARIVEKNPSLSIEMPTLSEINLEDLLLGYENYIYGITLVRKQRRTPNFYLDYSFEIADFDAGRDELRLIIEFLVANQHLFSDIETEEYRYIGNIFYRRFDENEPHVTARFFMNEEQTRILSDEIIGEEWWDLRQRGGVIIPTE